MKLDLDLIEDLSYAQIQQIVQDRDDLKIGLNRFKIDFWLSRKSII